MWYLDIFSKQTSNRRIALRCRKVQPDSGEEIKHGFN